MANSEVVIKPTVDTTALKNVERQYKNSFDRVARDAGQSLYRSLTSAIGRAAQSVSIGGIARAGAIGGTTLFGAITGSIFAASGQYQSAADLINNELGENQNRLRIQTAQALGVNDAEYNRALRATRAAGSLDDPTSRDLLLTLLTGIREGVEGFDLSGFSQDLGGVSDLIASLSTLSTNDRRALLQGLGVADNEDEAILQGLIAAGGFGNVEQQDIEAGARVRELSQLESEYQKVQSELTRQRQKAFVDEFNTLKNQGKNPFTAILETEQQSIDAQITALENINENAKVAEEQQKVIAGFVEQIAKISQEALPVIQEVGNFLGNPSGYLNESINNLGQKIEESVKNALPSWIR